MYVMAISQNRELADLFNDLDRQYGENWSVFHIHHRDEFDIVYVTIKVEEYEQDD